MTKSDSQDVSPDTSGTDTYAVTYEITIDRRAHDIWPRMINYQEWNPEHFGAKVQRLAGEKNKEGEIIVERKKTEGGYAPPMVIETVRVIPDKTIVWALYAPDTGASNGISFVDFTLREMSGKCLFTYNLYGWRRANGTSEAEKIAHQEAVMARVRTIFLALKEHAENA
jgi:hypothetical protein